MVDAVEQTIAAGEVLLVQAGTGTGKSLGYLVPAVAHAVTENERVVVATATLALQRQVMTRDLPLVVQSLTPALPRPPHFALLKGWHHYVCRHKIDGGYPVEEAPTLFDAESPGPRRRSADGAEPLGAQVLRLREWAEQTETGDRDDLVPGVSERAWRQASVRSMECLGRKCPQITDCFADRAKSAAHAADVVVTNHAILGIAASGSPGVLPEHQVLVVDEAHELADSVTNAATAELSVVVAEHALRLARRHAAAASPEADRSVEALGAALAVCPVQRFPAGLPDAVREAVALVRDATRTLLTAMKPTPGTADTLDGGRQMATSAVLALYEVAERMADPEQGAAVLWCARGDDGVPRLYAAPLAVGLSIRDQVLAGRSAVLTSATLTVGGTFDHLSRAVGLQVGPSATLPWRGLDVGTPFDHAHQGILYLARHLPPPGREQAPTEHIDELCALMEASGGGTLGLFSSRRAAQAAAEQVRARLGLPLFVQGDDQLPALVAAFAADPSANLFGTLSLWQGVDVPGETCRLVVIDRIPFPRPDDPVKAARSEAIDAAGGSGFMSVAAGHAATLLAQGAGRLIRADGDRGVVAILDSRVATARYGEFLLRSLPPFWRTTDRSVVLAALGRLATSG